MVTVLLAVDATKKGSLTAHLHVLVGVPVRVIDDYSVSRRQVDSKATRPRGKEKHEAVRAVVEFVHSSLAVMVSNRAIYPLGSVPSLV
jgi:hypothetical protein